MKIERFEDIIAWQKARDLTQAIYQSFHHCRDYGYRDQIERAAVSVMSNIAEGFERQGDKTFKQFLFIAKGSCAEVRSLIYLSTALKYLDEKSKQNLMDLTLEISRLISGLIKSLKE